MGVPSGDAADLDRLKLLYVGDSESARAQEFTGFLEMNVGSVEFASRENFQPQRAKGFDVVLLDWPQSSEARLERGMGSPLGTRSTWNKPTVLLGSAGLNLAVAWSLRGGSG